MEKRKINDFEVKKVMVPKQDDEDVAGFDLIPYLYCNTFISSCTKSGKTTILFRLIQKCINKNTHIIFFVGTLLLDPTYKVILKWLDKKGITYQCFLDIEHKGINALDLITNSLRLQGDSDDESSSDEEEHEPQICRFNNNDDDIKVVVRKPRKPKFRAPKYLFIFDDISSELRNPSIEQFLKASRHYKAKVFICSQSILDLTPKARNQIKVWLLLRGIEEDKLQAMHESCKHFDFKKFKEIYEDATKEPYNFMMCTTDKEYRCNFNYSYTV